MAKAPQTERCFIIMETLFQRVLDGMSNKEIADATGYGAVNVCRDMAILETLGYARKLPTDRWALTVKPVALMRSYQLHMDEMSRRASEFDARVTARARQNF